MSVRANKAIAERYIEMWHTGNKDIANEILTDNFIDHSHPELPRGPEGMKQQVEAYHKGFHHISQTVEHMLGEGDIVALHFTRVGKHEGIFAGFPPTGKEVVLTGSEFFRFEHGKIAELWGSQDGLEWAQQVGMNPPS